VGGGARGKKMASFKHGEGQGLVEQLNRSKSVGGGEKRTGGGGGVGGWARGTARFENAAGVMKLERGRREDGLGFGRFGPEGGKP